MTPRNLKRRLAVLETQTGPQSEARMKLLAIPMPTDNAYQAAKARQAQRNCLLGFLRPPAGAAAAEREYQRRRDKRLAFMKTDTPEQRERDDWTRPRWLDAHEHDPGISGPESYDLMCLRYHLLGMTSPRYPLREGLLVPPERPQ